jgi:diguanylate cyclase (GGDEF)-like protein
MSTSDSFQTGGSTSPGDARRHSIAAKIIFLVFLCTFSTALVISWIAIDASHTELRGRIERGFPAVLERSRSGLGPWLEEGSARLDAFARKTSQPDAELLRAFVERSPHFDAAAMIGDDSRWLTPVAEPDVPPLPAERFASSERPARATIRSGDGADAFALVPRVPGRASGGFFVARYDRYALDALLEAERHDSAGVVLLADEHGRLLAMAGLDADARREAVHSVERLRAGNRSTVQEYASRSGRHMLGALAPLWHDDPNTWVLVIEAPFESAFAPVLDAVKRIFVTDLLIILVFIAFAYRITTQMLRPIEELSECARLASRGDLSQAIADPGSYDEIGRLTRAFNEMMGKLRDSQMDLRRANRQLTSQNEELQRGNEVLSQLSITDGLTKLHNHRYFQERLTRELKRYGRTAKPLSMLLVDLDDFKALNDRLGHASGDELLVRVASILDANVRDTDLLARYGGEEFVVLATDTDLEGAVQLAEKIRMAVEQAVHIVNDSLRPIRITVSAGVAQYAGNRRLFFESADRALYRAKDQGKNCVVAASEDGTLD